MGELKADLIVSGGKLINVYSGEILDGFEVAVLDGRICYVGPSAKHTAGKKTEILDASGCYVSPGLIDGHTHIGHYARPFENLQSFLPHGTTSVVASADELCSVFGLRGLKIFLAEVAVHPLRVFTLVSMAAPQDPALCSTAAFSPDEIDEALDDSRVYGLGEIVSWLRLLQADDELLAKIEMAHHRGKIVQGHTAGARDQKLCAVAALGISSCHEPICFEDAIERLRLGYWTMLREGSLRQDLEETIPRLIRSGAGLQRVILVTDSMTPDDVAAHGHMDNVVRRAIKLGLAPLQALQAVTINPALCSGLEQEVGGLAPGRHADFVLIDDLDHCHVRQVWVDGKPAARLGVSEIQSAPIAVPQELMHSITLHGNISAETFRISAPALNPRIRVMELVNQTITAERVIECAAASGTVEANLYDDILKVAMFDRHGRCEEPAFGFLKGWGAKVGAAGLTTNLDENTLMVVGSDDGDMALCANALLEAGGGMAIVDGGEILDLLAFPCGGIFSLHPWQEVGRGLKQMQTRLKEMGSPFDKPIFALIFFPFVTLPALRITARGLVNAKERRIVPLFAA
jgi:adenine deaminase